MDAAGYPASPGASTDRASIGDVAGVAVASPRASPASPASSVTAGGPVDDHEEEEEGSNAPVVGEDAERLRVRLKMLDEHVFEVDATPSTPIAAFREQVARVTHVPPPRQRLIYRGKLMKDGAALSTYDVQDGHTVHLVAKPLASPTSSGASGAAGTAPASAVMQTPTAWEQSRDRLRQLLSSIDDDASERSGERDEASDREQSIPIRRRDRLAGMERNIASLREALDGASERHDAARPTPTPRLPQFREFFGDLETPALSMAAEMGLAAPSAAGTSHRGAAALDLEHIAQGMMTVRTILSTAAVDASGQQAQAQGVAESQDVVGEEAEPQTPPSSPGRAIRGRRRFFVGQWIDVKDTVNQWLECTIMDIADGKVLVHYHGWPTRWDEWLDFDSDRIAAFRTRTPHTLNARQMSPVPTTRVQDAPRVGSHDVRDMVIQLRDLMHEIMPHMDRFAELCEAQARDERGASGEENGVRYGDIEEAHGGGLSSDQRVASTVSAWDRADEVSEMAHLVAPVFDRVGRLLVDSARCLDPLLRPELQATSQRQQHRLAVMRGRRSASGVQRQATAARVRLMEQRDTSLSIRDLIATSPRNPSDSLPPRRSIDVHIHAIVSPASLSSFAALSRSAGSSARTIDPPPPREPDHMEFGEAFGIPSLRPSQDGASDGQAVLNDVDDDSSSDEESQDQSRIPLLGSSRGGNSTGEDRRRRAVEENLDAFLEDDFFGPSFDHLPTNRPAGSTSDQVSSSPSQYSSIPSPISDRSSVMGRRHVIPEIAEAEEREQMRARDRDAAGEASLEGHDDSDGARGSSSSSASSASSSSSSSARYPTFLEIVRRTLNGVRNLGPSSSTSRPRGDEETTGEPAGDLSASSSSSSLPSLSPRDVDDARHSYESHASEVEEDELDQLD